jgi:flagellar FliL protein
MADTEETIEDIEGTEEEETLEAGPQRRMFGPNMVRTLMFIAVALVVIIISGSIAYVVARRVNRAPAMDKRSPELAEKRDPLTPYTLDPPFSINTSDPEEPHFLRLAIVLGHDEDVSSELQGELINRKDQIRDVIISIVGEMSYRDLDTQDERNVLKDKIKRRINAILQKGQIKEVYFTEFVLT